MRPGMAGAGMVPLGPGAPGVGPRPGEAPSSWRHRGSWCSHTHTPTNTAAVVAEVSQQGPSSSCYSSQLAPVTRRESCAACARVSSC